MLSVEVRYQLEDGTWRDVAVEPDGYFWMDPDQPEVRPGPSSAPRHDGPWELVPEGDRARLQAIVTAARESATGEVFRCAYTFWRGVDNHVCLVSRTLLGVESRELIIMGEVPFKPHGRQVLRVELSDVSAQLTMNWLGWGSGGDEFGYDVKRGHGDA